jgi:hypothetical protein
MAGYDGATFQIEHRWKEEVIYWEGSTGFCLDAGWGVSPPILYVPSATLWDQVVPVWLRGRRDEVIARLQAHGEHVLEETDSGYTERSVVGREVTR